MPKQNSFANTLIIGIIWSAVYLKFGHDFIYQTYEFDTFSSAHWNRLLLDFRRGSFQVNSWQSLGFFSAVVWFFPVWLGGWYWLKRYNLLGIFKRKKKAEKFIPQDKTQKKFVPQKMNMQTGVVFTISPTAPKPATNAPTPAVPKRPQNPNTDIINQIASVAQNYQVEVFKNIALNNQLLDLSIATDEAAFLISILNKPDAAWFFDAEQTNADSSGFSKEGHIQSPIYVIDQVRQGLVAENPDAVVHCFIVMANGSFIDLDEAQNICAQHDIKIVQFNNPQMANYTTLQSVIDENFMKKETA